jgi:hypothetical protein
MGRIAGRFGRVEPRRHARALVLGLAADLPRKHCWTIAEPAGTTSPDGLQHLLARAVWDADALRDDVRDYVTSYLGDPQAVLVIDETGDLKGGTTTAGVQRQYTGTAGKIDSSQVAVCLAYATMAGHALIDRELYLPQSWTGDRDRCRAAGVPDQVTFATKPTLATRMLTRALDAGVVAGWVAGDEVDGADPKLRAALQARRLGYVLAVACDHRVPGHCCVESKGAGGAERSGGCPHRDSLKKVANRPIVPTIYRVLALKWRQPDGVIAQCNRARRPRKSAPTFSRTAWTRAGCSCSTTTPPPWTPRSCCCRWCASCPPTTSASAPPSWLWPTS